MTQCRKAANRATAELPRSGPHLLIKTIQDLIKLSFDVKIK